MWGGDFNITPCSPLYTFLRTGSTAALKQFAHNNWTGQTQVHSIHTKLQSSMLRKLSLLNEHFDVQKHGRYLYPESNPLFFPSLEARLASTILVLNPSTGQIEYGVSTPNILSSSPSSIQSTDNSILSLQSAYGQAHLQGQSPNYSMTGEMLFSTIPVQDPYPFTVDYIFYSSLSPDQSASKQCLSVEAVLLAPSVDDLKYYNQLPNKYHSSDHFPLYSLFSLPLPSKPQPLSK